MAVQRWNTKVKNFSKVGKDSQKKKKNVASSLSDLGVSYLTLASAPVHVWGQREGSSCLF